MRKKILFAAVLVTLFTNCASFTLRTPPPRNLYDNITIEIAPVTSATPSNDALEYLRSKLDEYRICSARGIKFVIRPEVEVISGIPWNSSKIRSYENTRRTLRDTNTKDRHLIMFMAYVSGSYLEGKLTNIAGLQYNNSIAIFKDSQVWKYEGSVLLHEFGHLLEIADANHRKDEEPVNPDRPNHCNNRRCVMFWQVQRKDADFDEQCLEELRALVDSAQ